MQPSAVRLRGQELGRLASDSSRLVHGVVLDEGGDALTAARVFLLSKTSPSSVWQDAAPYNFGVDGSGSWKVAYDEVPGCWIGAIAEGYLPAHVDGDSVRMGGPLIRLVLQRGPGIGVAVRGSEGGPTSVSSRVHVRPHEAGVPWPTPGAIWAFNKVIELPAGALPQRFTVGTKSLVVVKVRPNDPHLVVYPSQVIAAPPVENIEFALEPSCAITIFLFDARTGQPLDSRLEYFLARDGEELMTGRRVSARTRRVDLDENLPTGMYMITILAPGYQMKTIGPVQLDYPGAAVSLREALEPEAGCAGVLEIELSDALAGPLKGVELTSPGAADTHAVFLQRRLALGPSSPGEPDAAGAEWEPVDDSWLLRQGGGRYLLEGECEGLISMIVVAPTSGRIGYSAPVTIPPAGKNTLSVGLEPGIHVNLRDLRRDGYAIHSVRCHHPDYGDMPIYTCSARCPLLNWSEIPDWCDSLGPYPGPWIQVIIGTKDGRELVRTYR